MAEGGQRFQIVLTTAGSEEQASQIARALVERRLAACVSVIDQVCSFYVWKGKVTEEGERLLLIKTEKRLFAEVRDAIQELHSYELPEIVALPIRDGDAGYLEWLAGCLKSEA